MRPAGAARRVLIASYRAHPFVGGQGVYVRALARALRQHGHSVEVIAGPPYPELDPGIALHRLSSLDLFSVENAFMAFRPGFVSRPADLAEWALHNTGAFGEPFAFAVRLRAWLAARPGQYDILHDNQGLAGPMRAIPRLPGAPTLTATLHHPITVDLEHALANEPTRIGRMFLRRWHSFLAAQACTARSLKGLISVSNAAKARAVADFDLEPDRVWVAHNGIDHGVFHPRPAITRDPNLIVTAASADIPLKGLPVLIAAFAKVCASNPAARLTVIGRLRDGPSQDALTKAGLGDRVTFVSDLTNEEMANLYARAGIVACPSLFEGFGFPAAEAMACAAPVVASDGGALPEVVGDAGLIAPAGDAAAFASALMALMADPGRRLSLSHAAAERARSAFSWHRHAAAVSALYDTIAPDPMRQVRPLTEAAPC